MAITHEGAEIEHTARRAASGARTAVRRAARVIDDVADDATDAAQSGIGGAVTAIEDALEWAGGRMSALGDRIQERPLQTAAIAVGAGALLAWLLRR